MTTWRDRAACLIEDPELFFPISTHPGRQTAEAKAVCRTCPVRDACLTWALETHQDYGIWGGLTEAERRTIRNRDQRATTRARKVGTPMSSTEVAAIAKVASVAAVEEHCQDQRTVVATLTTRGQSAAEISRRLGISARTVGRMRAQARAGAA